MSTITLADEAKRREGYTCNCSGRVCGVNRDYGQIKQDFINGFVGGQFTLAEAEAIDRKWKSLGKAASKPGWRGGRS